ncbi:histidyl-tRNA synthetase [Capsaspora owczarzaki ATCC 30864]|uniref:histidyl-tRNA synthetase n=1 Tax=Capsaspora owczarzaki (strain ATCC 30864) TaxID=595528 RepID=UPI0001FE3AD4|nr:histidyl-tRNA synthetase [Capsaspora owczarzaki ATCC 30864]|eukprot:XP_004365472.1 histidyl-tRNA synthetase [Capsaspora owczarzaki ATCC 30864]
MPAAATTYATRGELGLSGSSRQWKSSGATPAKTARPQLSQLTFGEVTANLGFGEVETPIVEQESLFKRSIGADSSVVMKEMYAFDDPDGGRLCLRPEGTAGVMRAVLQRLAAEPTPSINADVHASLCYTGPMFRREKPQAGRYRQFLQCGVEYLGSAGVDADGLVLYAAWRLIRELGLSSQVVLQLNTLGTSAERYRYVQALRDYLEPRANELSGESLSRLRGRTPVVATGSDELRQEAAGASTTSAAEDTGIVGRVLRILDSKHAQDHAVLEAAPLLSDFLDPSTHARFAELKETLEALAIPFTVNPRLVRGLDYYSHTVFEIVANSGVLGAQSTVLAGGRYDELSLVLGGKRKVPAVGWAAGVERLSLARASTPQGPSSKTGQAECGLAAPPAEQPLGPFAVPNSVFLSSRPNAIQAGRLARVGILIVPPKPVYPDQQQSAPAAVSPQLSPSQLVSLLYQTVEELNQKGICTIPILVRSRECTDKPATSSRSVPMLGDQLRAAARHGLEHVVLLYPDQAATGTAVVRHLASAHQQSVSLTSLATHVLQLSS